MQFYTDGSSIHNPGETGCAFVVVNYNTAIYEEYEYLGRGTNNFAELMAIKRALECAIKKNWKRNVIILTDSQYCRGLFGLNYKAKKNVELVNEIKDLISKVDKFKIKWVRGHNGNIYNDKADQLALLAASSRAKGFHKYETKSVSKTEKEVSKSNKTSSG